MPFDANAKSLTVAVVGTGTMGRGVVQVAAQGGLSVIAYDEKPGAAQAAKDYIAKMLNSLVEKGRLASDQAASALARITVAPSFDAVADANVVIEAVIERLDVKQDLFARLDTLCGPDVILASNTSSLPVTAIAAKCSRPERVAGMHFFNPVPLMRLVEVIGGLKTAPWTTEALMVLARRMTREPILCIDSPGFVVNHIGRAYTTEVPRILTEGIARHFEIDRIMTGAPGFKLGMFALADMVGIDVGYAVMESLYQQFQHEPAYAPNPLSALRAAGGLFGQKSGAGWYDYTGGKRVEPPLAPPPTVALPAAIDVWTSSHHPDLQAPMIDLLRNSGVAVNTTNQARPGVPLILNQIGYDLTTAISEVKLPAASTVSVDVLFGMKGPRTLMVTPATDPAIRDAVHAALAADGQEVVVINDSPGYVAQRVVAMIVNTGAAIAQRGIATPADIDKGAKLGLGYPFGPLEWGDSIGAAHILFILERLHAFYQEPRYRPNPWLKRRALLGLPLSQPDGKA